ncbi:MAG: PKD domain-containing protein [Candidatus Bipolaricaulota bacterium]|nr:PKD domain-containing protein [Candidatus Bipolaricaulota bacterium]
MRKRSRTTRGCSPVARRILVRGTAVAACLAALGGGGIGGRDAAPADVVIHEVCWTGTRASAADEWIELRSNVDHAVSLSGWRLVAEDGVPAVALSGILGAQGFFLLERTDDSTVADVAADVLFTGTLENSGETLYLYDAAGRLVDSVECGGGWFAGESAPSYASMERVNSKRSGVAANWRTHDGSVQNGHDAAGHALRGTPRTANSVTKPPLADFAVSLASPTIWDEVAFSDLSTDVDGWVSSWRWDFGDGVVCDTRSAVHRFRSPGTYCVVLTIEDDDGLAARCERWVVASTGSGDLNGDEQIDLLDVRLCLELAQGFGGTASEDADVDHDGDVDLDDAKKLAEFVLGL